MQPAEMAGWWPNSGPEAMARLDDGRFVILAEQRSRFGGESHEGLLFEDDPVEGGEPIVFSAATPERMRPVDMTAMPDGRMLIVLRDFNWIVPPRWSVALAVADPAEIREGENWELEVIAKLAGPIPIDNYEGVAIELGKGGDCHVWLISDDNFSKLQRSLLLKLKWPRCGQMEDAKKPSAPSGTEDQGGRQIVSAPNKR